MVHYHVWVYRDRGGDVPTAMFRKAHPHKTKQAASQYGKRTFPLYALYLPCESEACAKHKCRGSDCPNANMRRGKKRDKDVPMGG